ncbi:hypothetical protein CY34DRAFT_98437 [Suillus luteus UH-Slu-Lm8-n1]|uniref:CxC1-like cysteine cluster associated with KDZ transposases domain-containing protein n=1 Tax=Suillus luteus UH-Slu-Lm8-n1 TaxID=930992 RepID=A0A0C9ZXK7_9AGAM|nr:hypothetical protein CY34DRAFT_98437 [Suillus luteus UH-Slu-Lm8-n1]
MTVLHSGGPRTTSAGILRIRQDRLNAECQLAEEMRTRHAQEATLSAEAALEIGSSMDTTDDTFHNYDHSQNNIPAIQDSDDDDSSGDDEESRGAYSVEDKLFSAYARVCLNSRCKCRHDQRTSAIHYANMHDVWNLQLPKLADAYLHWKHIGRHDLDVEPESSAHQFHISTVDVFEFQPVRTITQHDEEVANAALVRVGLLGCSPTVPSVAITLQCLELYHQLRRHQSSFSIQAFAKVLYATLGWTEPNWHLRHSCPACTFEQSDEPALYPASLKAMDGNNLAKRMATAGHADHRKFTSQYMITSEDVEVFKDDVHLRPGERGADSDANTPLACTDNWKAANSTTENTVKIFEQTGIFLSACRHGMVQTIAEMWYSGELAKYPLATINKLINIFGHNQAIGSDIGCSLTKTVAASSIHDKAADHHLLLAVNAFHGHAHNCKCQLRHHPLYLRGFGLEDFETCERIFAGSNAAASLIWHASHFHYVQYLNLHFDQWDTDRYPELSRFLFNNYRQALTIIADYTKEIEAYRAVYPDEVLDFDSWIDEELQYLVTVGSEPQHDALTVEYVDALEKLAKYENAFNSSRQDQFVSYNQSSFTPNSDLSISASQATKQGHAARRAAECRLQVQINVVEDLEIRLGVSERWTPDHEEYVKALEYSRRWHFVRAVEELESLVVQRLFELSKANLTSTGYKLRKQISKAIVKRSGAIRTALDKYNKLAVSQNPRRPTLQYSKILTKPWKNPTHREMAVKHFKVLCAWEEIIRLNVGICQLQAWVDTEDADMEQAAADLESTNSPLAAQLNMLACCQRRINTVHRGHLMRIYCLEGYTGRAPITSSYEGNSSDVEDADVEGLDGGDGEEAARFEACIEQMSRSL